jgi:hypothetical protein
VLVHCVAAVIEAVDFAVSRAVIPTAAGVEPSAPVTTGAAAGGLDAG